jgi:osmotically-inducible protein OsmY
MTKPAASVAVLPHPMGARPPDESSDIKPHPSRKLVEQSIESAFQRNAVLDARHIEIEIYDGTITLRGTVQSLQE